MSSVLEQSPVEAFTCVEGSPYLFSVDDFYRMVDLDILPKGNRASLWDGLVYEKPAKTIVHAFVGSKLNYAVFHALPPTGWFFSLDNSITIGPYQAPAPDGAVIRGEPEDYLERRPNAADAGLLIEMNDEIIKNDIGRKLAAYASTGIPAYWVVDLKDLLVHVYESPIPSESRYASMASFKPGEMVPFSLDGAQDCLIAASDLLPVR